MYVKIGKIDKIGILGKIGTIGKIGKLTSADLNRHIPHRYCMLI